jgi:hypothetical protein
MKKTLILVTILLGLMGSTALAAVPARVKTWSSGEVLSASDLNTEFNVAVTALSAGTGNLLASTLQLGSALYAGATHVSTLNATGNTVIDGTLGVTGAVELKSTLTTSDTATIAGSGATDCLIVKDGSTQVVRVNASGNMTLGATDLAGTTTRCYSDGSTVGYAYKGLVANGGNGVGVYVASGNGIGSSIYPIVCFGRDTAGASRVAASVAVTQTGITATDAGAKIDAYTHTAGVGPVLAMTIDDSQEIFFPGLGTTTATAANAVLEGSSLQLKIVSSLRALKTDIKPINTDWDLFMKLNPVSFVEKVKKSGPRIYGFIAEEIEKLYKPLAVYAADGNLQSVAYDRITAINTAAIQDLKRENDELRKDLLALTRRVEKLEKK